MFKNSLRKILNFFQFYATSLSQLNNELKLGTRGKIVRHRVFDTYWLLRCHIFANWLKVFLHSWNQRKDHYTQIQFLSKHPTIYFNGVRTI